MKYISYLKKFLESAETMQKLVCELRQCQWHLCTRCIFANVIAGRNFDPFYMRREAASLFAVDDGEGSCAFIE